MQTHLGTDPTERLGQKMLRAHPRLYRAKGMLNRLLSNKHHFWIKVQPVLCRFKYGFMLPTGNTSLLPRRALLFKTAAFTV